MTCCIARGWLAALAPRLVNPNWAFYVVFDDRMTEVPEQATEKK
jgi:hypothetical protein